jgi:chromosome segregation ATPase
MINSLIQAQDELSDLLAKHQALLSQVIPIMEQMVSLNARLQLLKEIYNLAETHFPRLQEKPALTAQDTEELEKWIYRARTDESLHDIIAALNQLRKYKPSDIKSLYAFVQKIIIEGPKNRKEVCYGLATGF